MTNLCVDCGRPTTDGRSRCNKCYEREWRAKNPEKAEIAYKRWYERKKLIELGVIEPQKKRESIHKKVPITPLKPWDDHESLFCDTVFLTKLLGKKPRSGNECRDKDIGT